MKSRLLNWLWLGLFVGGVITSFFYVQGWRFSPARGTVEPTGVLELSTFPSSALIFSEERFLGTSPLLLRGQPLGELQLRLERSGFRAEELLVTIQPDLVTRIQHFVLTPLFPEQAIEPLGSDAEIFWAPDFTRFARLFPAQKAMEFRDLTTDTQMVIELEKTPKTAYFRADGTIELVLQDGTTQALAASSASQSASTQTPPAAAGTFFAQGTELWQRDQTSTPRLVFKSDEPILFVEQLSESDDVVLVLPSGIDLWNSELQQERSFLVVAGIEAPHFISASKRLIYKNNGIWKSIIIGL